MPHITHILSRRIFHHSSRRRFIKRNIYQTIFRNNIMNQSFYSWSCRFLIRIVFRLQNTRWSLFQVKIARFDFFLMIFSRCDRRDTQKTVYWVTHHKLIKYWLNGYTFLKNKVKIERKFSASSSFFRCFHTDRSTMCCEICSKFKNFVWFASFYTRKTV